MRLPVLLAFPALLCAGDSRWVRHVITEDFRTNTAVAADFTGDGRVDVIANCSTCKEDVLFVAPDWKRITLHKGHSPIHSVVLDADGDGDPDYVAAQYTPGFIYWLQRPANPLDQSWKLHAVDDATKGGVNGIHGLATGDVNRDGKPDLIGNSAQPGGSFPNSIAWFEAPRFERHILADKDAPGLSHYLGFGDVNGDGRPDVASGAKTPPEGNWFAWWEAPQDPRAVWKKHLIAANQEGASNIFVVDVNGDGKADLLSSRGHGKGVLWFEGPGWKPREIDGAHQYPHSLAPGDLDGDGDVDAVACSAVYAGEPKAPRLAWYENTGHGRFRTHEISATQASYDVKLADMDRDGDLDILVAGQESRNVVWYENRLKAGRVR